MVLLALGFAASLGIVELASHSPVATAAFGGGVVALGACLRALLRHPPTSTAEEFAPPDWSVTVAAIEQPDCAVAVTDRAARLVCANKLYESWFGAGYAPPRLAVDEASAGQLTRAAREAWRDGEGKVDVITQASAEVGSGAGTGARWQVSAVRAGRAEDFLVWRFTAIVTRDPLAEMAGHMGGKLGRALGKGGFATAIVYPDGKICATNDSFARSAAGDARANLAGIDFVACLRQDEAERIYWAHDVRHVGPLTMYYLPVVDPDTPGKPNPNTTPSLMLLVNADAGLGGGARAAAAPNLEALLAQLPLGLAMADRDGRLLFANPAFMRAAGHEGEAPPTYPTDLVVREDKAALADAVRRFGQGGGAAGDVAVRLAAQPDDPVTLSLAGVRGLGEAAVLLSLSDSTEETRLKRQVAQATKMQAVGQLAGGVAHDFNNVLTAIIGTCDLMLLRHTPGDSDYDDIQQIRASSSRAASLTRQLLAFSRQQTLRPQVVQLPDIVSEISQMLRRLVGEKIAFVVTHDRDLGPVRADPTQLEQVIVNLVVNARDAMQDHARRSGGSDGGGAGRLTLATRRVTSADVRAMRSEILPIGDYTALIVEDTGGGIPPEHLGKIWEPFFTTKEPGRGGSMGGTGLGLSTVYGIVKQSGGFIFADTVTGQTGAGPNGAGPNGAGQGARFSIYLPVHHGAPGEVAAAKPREEAASWAGGGDILLVEDEDTVRMVAERALTRAGYSVTCACDGDEGLEKFTERLAAGGDMFAMVVSDVVMPAMDGPAMVRAMRAKVANLPVLFMSGYAEEQLRREIDMTAIHFLPKPFSVQQISVKAAQIVRAQQQREVEAKTKQLELKVSRQIKMDRGGPSL